MPKYYTIQQASKILGIPASTLYDHARAGKLAHLGAIRVGTRTVIPKTAIDKDAA